MKLLAVRHGVTPFNTQQRWQGLIDIPLAKEGRRQALMAARQLVKMDWRGRRVFCSTLSRSIVTADTICAELHLDPPEIIPQLGERELGEWEGLTVDEIEQSSPGSIAAWTSGAIDGPPGGEADITVAGRFREACKAIGASAATETDPILIITHAGVLHAVDKINGIKYSKYSPLCGRWFELDETSPNGGISPDGTVDLLADIFDPAGPDILATQARRDR